MIKRNIEFLINTLIALYLYRERNRKGNSCISITLIDNIVSYKLFFIFNLMDVIEKYKHVHNGLSININENSTELMEIFH